MERRTALLGCVLIVCLALLGAPGITADELDIGSVRTPLKLMVTDCSDEPLDNVDVDVEIYRSGSGIIATDSGYTDEGAITFGFWDLEYGDEARVTLTPSGSDPDDDHVYIFLGGEADDPTVWDLGGRVRTEDPCGDQMWDEENGIIQSVYD